MTTLVATVIEVKHQRVTVIKAARLFSVCSELPFALYCNAYCFRRMISLLDK